MYPTLERLNVVIEVMESLNVANSLRCWWASPWRRSSRVHRAQRHSAVRRGDRLQVFRGPHIRASPLHRRWLQDSGATVGSKRLS